ncbi:hypothetical protein DL768_006397 [Monosporascus sp. mg162]|nr:hypothetical protein DL768_006397 [Monosporascus sp. mg162]
MPVPFSRPVALEGRPQGDLEHVRAYEEAGRSYNQQLEVGMAGEADYDNPASFEDAVTGEAREQKKVEYRWDLQATHGSAIGRQHYAVNIQFPNQLQPQMVANYRKVSRLWHLYLSLPGGGGEADKELDVARGDIVTLGTRTPRATAGTKRPVATEPQAGWEAVKTPDSAAKRRMTAERIVAIWSRPVDAVEAKVNAGLGKLLGDDAGWQSGEQRECMRQVMTPQGGQEHLRHATGAAVDERRVSIVVAPFVALMDDLVNLAHGFGIDCLRWLPAETAGREVRQRVARLVVASADQANNAEFVAYADGLRGRGLLKRIFVD